MPTAVTSSSKSSGPGSISGASSTRTSRGPYRYAAFNVFSPLPREQLIAEDYTIREVMYSLNIVGFRPYSIEFQTCSANQHKNSFAFSLANCSAREQNRRSI